MTAFETLGSILNAFQDNRARTMEPEALAENQRQRQSLVDNGDPGRFPRPGQAVPDFELLPVDGGRLTRDELLAEGPVALVFFRFAGCPACNIALPYYDRHLRPALAARGVRLIAVSPQVPARLADIGTRHDLGVTIASDPDNALARALGVTFLPDAEAWAFARARGSDLPSITGASTWELPMPAILLIDRTGTIRFVEVTPDWLARTEVAPVLAAADQLSADASAA